MAPRRAAQHAFTEVDPKSGLPTKPEKYVKGYGLQLGCIAREWGKINDDNLKAKENEGLAAYLIDKLHTRYKFPAPYDNKVSKPILLTDKPSASSPKPLELGEEM